MDVYVDGRKFEPSPYRRFSYEQSVNRPARAEMDWSWDWPRPEVGARVVVELRQERYPPGWRGRLRLLLRRPVSDSAYLRLVVVGISLGSRYTVDLADEFEFELSHSADE